MVQDGKNKYFGKSDVEQIFTAVDLLCKYISMFVVHFHTSNNLHWYVKIFSM